MTDPYFQCAACGGQLVEVESLPDGRKVFNCDGCHKNRLETCRVCGFPRAMMSGDVCLNCAITVGSGKSPETAGARNEVIDWLQSEG